MNAARIGTAGSRLPSTDDPKRYLLLLFFRAIEVEKTEAFQDLRDSVLPFWRPKPAVAPTKEHDPAEPMYDLSGPGFDPGLPFRPLQIPTSNEGEPPAARPPIPTGSLQDLVLSEWERRWHLDRWKSPADHHRFRLLIVCALVLWSSFGDLDPGSSEDVALASGWAEHVTDASPDTFLSTIVESKARGTVVELLLGSFLDPGRSGADFRIQLALGGALLRGVPEESRSLFRRYLQATSGPPPYDPLALTREDWTKQARAYLDEVDALAESLGLPKPAEKREPMHFRWLARYQVGSVEIPMLADEVYISGSYPTSDAEGTIRRSVQRTSTEIGLTMRRRPGRPRKENRT